MYEHNYCTTALKETVKSAVLHCECEAADWTLEIESRGSPFKFKLTSDRQKRSQKRVCPQS